MSKLFRQSSKDQRPNKNSKFQISRTKIKESALCRSLLEFVAWNLKFGSSNFAQLCAFAPLRDQLRLFFPERPNPEFEMSSSNPYNNQCYYYPNRPQVGNGHKKFKHTFPTFYQSFPNSCKETGA